MATLKAGKPYIHVTWLAKLLGGNQCVWSAWFRSRHKYDKFEEEALDLVRWNQQHNELMRRRKAELEREGWTVSMEEANAFKLEGQVAIVAGKPDIVATRPGLVLVVDGKTGRPRESDVWQVLLYLYALPKSRPDLVGELEGEVQYQQGDERITVTPGELTPERMEQMVALIKDIAGAEPPLKVATRGECKRCNIGVRDCPDRVGPIRRQQTVAVGEF
jgi:CRISPR/Cas system-associated exonuclease Cas4 (RecB family)